LAILGLDRTQHQLLCYYFPFVTGSTELASTFVITINNITIFGFSSGVTKRSSPNYRQALNVMGKAMTTQPDRQNRVLFDILYLSNCLNKQIDYLCTMDNISCIRQQADIKQINRCKDRVLELNGSFDYLSNGLELAGNNVRLKILFLLYEEQQLCVCDLSDILGMTISAISQHLRKLKDRKLIETERQAQTIFYSLTKEYEKMLKPFFKILHENKILETI
jgi:DNA-binding transcriptional ArsR family regulator